MSLHSFLTTLADSLAEQDLCDKITDDALRSAAGCSSSGTADSLAGTVVNFLLYGVGLASVVMLIFGAVQIATSAGNASNVEKGKKTIIYSLIGLIISVFAYAIVNYVLDLF